MGRPKAALPYGAATLLEFQTGRLANLFEEVFAVVKDPPDFPVGPARVLRDGVPDHAAIYGLLRALEEAEDRAFLMAVDLPALPLELVRAVTERGSKTAASVLLPRAGGVLQPLAAVWRREVLSLARERIARGSLSLHGLAEEAGAEVFSEEEWREMDPSGNAFLNMNTLEEYAAMRERA
jgi:molybdopterin-guanine dinucleotide biosynthesis protein A